MAYNAVVCNVMIASPSDVKEERDIARAVIWNWNYLHSDRTKIVLIPVGWETHSAPAMGDRPQAIINKQVLDGCDLLVGIFWTRLGTPTGQDVSGTVEEINRHVQKGKPAMLYFSLAPVRPDSVDSEEYERLKGFKEQCETRGLIDTYETQGQFKDKLTSHLVRTIFRDEYFTKIGEQPTNPAVLETANDSDSEELLSKEARELLLEAVKDPHGSVIRVMTSGGLTIQANSRNMVTEPHDGRCEAIWQGALDELLENDLLADRGYKGEVFQVTREGYALADRLKAFGSGL